MSHEVLNSYFEENELEQVNQRANAEGFSEKMDEIKNDPDYRLSLLEERIDKTPDTFEARFNAFKQAVEQAEQNKAAPVEEMIQSAAEKLHIQKQDLSQGLKQNLAQSTGWKEGIALWGLKLTKNADQETGFIATIKKIFGGLMLSIFGGDIYKKYQKQLSSIDNENASFDKKDNENSPEILNTNIKYNGVVKIYTTIASTPENNKNSIGEILLDPTVKSTPLNQIPTQNPKNSELFKQLTLRDRYEGDDVLATFKSLTSGKGRNIIANILDKSEHVDKYKKYTIEDLLFAAAKDFQLLINIGSWEGIDSLKIDLHSTVDSQSTYGKLGLNANIISKAATSDFFFDKTGSENLFNQLMKDNETQDQESLKKIIKFGYSIQNMLLTNPRLQLGNASDITNLFDIQKLSLKEVLEIYVITGGESNFDTLNAVQQSYIYFAIPGLLSSRGRTQESAAYTVAMMEEITGSIGEGGKNINDKIPNGVKLLLEDAFNGILTQAGNSIKKVGEILTGAFRENPEAGVLITAGALFAPIFSVRTSLFGKLFQ